MRLVARSLLAAALTLAGALPAWPVPAASAAEAPRVDLPALLIEYAYGPPMAGRGYSTGSPRDGSWRIVGGRLGDDRRLTLEVEVTPPAAPTFLEAGPAILFGRLELEGGMGGDVGATAAVHRVAAVVLEPCPDPQECAHRGSITLPTDRLPQAVRANWARGGRAKGWHGVAIGLTLVRTFGQGSWLQVLPMFDETLDESGGTLADPLPHESRLLNLGAFPVDGRPRWNRRNRAALARIERLRRSAPDARAPPVTVPVVVDILMSARTPGWTIATPAGDPLLNVRRSERASVVPSRTRNAIDMPVGVPWLVWVPTLDRVDNLSPARTLGPFAVGAPGRLSGWVSGDEFLCAGAQAGSVRWHPLASLASKLLPPRWW